jgi:predicted TIM-barrel fold metal-dependent hydrolase
MSAPKYRRIATEEAWQIPEILQEMRALAAGPMQDPDLVLWRILLGDTAPSRETVRRLLDVEGGRMQEMDAFGVDVHLLLLTSPGVQMLPPAQAASLAELANDRLADIIGRHPKRFAGLAVVAPQSPVSAAKEIDRAMTKLKLNGIVINSHTNGEYLDEEQYWPILEAAEALDAPIYIHPRSPPAGAAAYLAKYHLEDAIWGFQAETGLHGVRLIMRGVFDRFPKLRIVLGHMGEGIPYWLHRLDHMHRASAGSQAAATGAMAWRPALKLRPSEYFRQNFLITTSGMNWNASLDFCLRVVGADNIMWAVDYPYQETKDAVPFMDAAPISDADKHKIYHGNAERVFRIPPA